MKKFEPPSYSQGVHHISDVFIHIASKKITFLLRSYDQVQWCDTRKLWVCTLIGSVNVFCLSVFYQERIQIENGTLIIHMLNMSDSGLYQCVAENKYDTIYANAELRVIGE